MKLFIDSQSVKFSEKLTNLVTNLDRLTYFSHILLTILLFSWPVIESAKIVEKPSYCREKKHNRNQMNSFLWRIERNPPSYFFGTIHVPYTEVWDHVHRKAKQAFARSNAVVLELDLNNARTLNQLALCQFLPRGTRLNSYIPRDLYKKLETKMSQLRDSIRQWIEIHEPQEDADKVFMRLAGDWQRKRPVWIMLMLSSLSLDGIKNREIPILDLYLAQEALKASKPLGVVEKAVEQCRPMNLLNETHVLYLLDHALDRVDHQKLTDNRDQDRSSIKNLIEHYNCGSLDEKVFAMDSIQIPDIPVEGARKDSDVNNSDLSVQIAPEINDYLRYELLTKRNIRMAQRVVEHLESQPEKSIFFAFGAAHFLGENDSVVSLVRQSGYKIAPVPMQQREHRHRKRKNRPKSKSKNVISNRSTPKEYNKIGRQNYRNFHELWVKRQNLPPINLNFPFSNEENMENMKKNDNVNNEKNNVVILRLDDPDSATLNCSSYKIGALWTFILTFCSFLRLLAIS